MFARRAYINTALRCLPVCLRSCVATRFFCCFFPAGLAKWFSRISPRGTLSSFLFCLQIALEAHQWMDERADWDRYIKRSALLSFLARRFPKALKDLRIEVSRTLPSTTDAIVLTRGEGN